MAKPKVVVLGAGFAGVFAAQSLHGAEVDVTLVDKKSFMEVTWANVRSATVESALAEKTTISYSDIPKLPPLVQSSATSVTDNSVTLANGQRLPFDYLVLATGSSYSQGGVWCPTVTSRAARITDLKDQEAKLRAAQSVLVIGGGAVGVEVAGEVATDMPEKKVTLVHARDILVDGKDVKQHKAVAGILKKKGVEIILGQKVKQVSPGRYQLSPSGETLDADLAYMCTGSRPNTAFLQDSMPDILDVYGYVKVNEHFQVEGHPNIFAVGDIMNTNTAKLGYLAMQEGKAAAKVILAIIKGGANAKLAAWKPNNGFDGMFISLGRNAGAGHIGSMHPWSFLVTNIKSKSLFVDKTRKDMGLKV